MKYFKPCHHMTHLPPRFPISRNKKNTSTLNRDNKYILFIDADNVNDFEIDERIEMDIDKDDTVA